MKEFLMGTTKNKLYNSFVICVGAVVAIIVLKYLFPVFDWASTESAILTVIAAWILNTVREATK